MAVPSKEFIHELFERVETEISMMTAYDLMNHYFDTRINELFILETGESYETFQQRNSTKAEDISKD